MVAMEVQTNQYLGGDSSLTCSTETQTKIDEKVVEVVRSEHEKAAGISDGEQRKTGRSGKVSV